MLSFFNVVFAIWITGCWVLNVHMYVYTWYNAALESILIILGTLFYFYELFNGHLGFDWIQESPIWAISGMLISFGTILPLALFFEYLRKIQVSLANSLYAINNIAYSLLFTNFIVTILLERRLSKRSGV